MVGTILLIVVLVLASAALIVMEICTPFFGLLTVLSAGCLVGAVVSCFRLSQVTGVVAVIVALLAYPTFIIAAVKWIPRTRLGRRLVLSRGQAPRGEGTPEAQSLSALVGREGIAETLLRPGGAVRIDGRRIIASAESGLIEKGVPVKVVRVQGADVVVRRVASEANPPAPA